MLSVSSLALIRQFVNESAARRLPFVAVATAQRPGSRHPVSPWRGEGRMDIRMDGRAGGE